MDPFSHFVLDTGLRLCCSTVHYGMGVNLFFLRTHNPQSASHRCLILASALPMETELWRQEPLHWYIIYQNTWQTWLCFKYCGLKRAINFSSYPHPEVESIFSSLGPRLENCSWPSKGAEVCCAGSCHQPCSFWFCPYGNQRPHVTAQHPGTGKDKKTKWWVVVCRYMGTEEWEFSFTFYRDTFCFMKIFWKLVV